MGKAYKLLCGLFIIAITVLCGGCCGCGNYATNEKIDAIHSAVADFRRDMGVDAYYALNENKDLIRILASTGTKNGKTYGPWLVNKKIITVFDEANAKENGHKYSYSIIISTQDNFHVVVFEDHRIYWSEDNVSARERIERDAARLTAQRTDEKQSEEQSNNINADKKPNEEKSAVSEPTKPSSIEVIGETKDQNGKEQILVKGSDGKLQIFDKK